LNIGKPPSGLWKTSLGISEPEIRQLLEKLKNPISPRAKKLPKGAIKILKAQTRQKLFKPIHVIQESPIFESTSTFVKVDWRIIGQKRDIKFVKTEEVLSIHYELVKDFRDHNDPINPCGIRSPELLQSAVFRSSTSLGDSLKYPTVEMSGAALFHSMVHNHPFFNGNKRTALVALLVFLDKNGLMLVCNEDELFKYVLKLAQHQIVKDNYDNLPDQEVLLISEWIKEWTRPILKGDRPIQFRKLESILNKYGCKLEHSTTGSNIKIIRKIPSSGIWARSKTLTSNISYSNRGRELKRATLNKIRADLHLDEANGIDSSAFYDDLPFSTADFILRYRKTLYRLAKL
jgi:death-on-curing family protein